VRLAGPEGGRPARIIDATIVSAPKQHNSREENETIKDVKTPEDWKSKPEPDDALFLFARASGRRRAGSAGSERCLILSPIDSIPLPGCAEWPRYLRDKTTEKLDSRHAMLSPFVTGQVN